jgi:hypothetical protein
LNAEEKKVKREMNIRAAEAQALVPKWRYNQWNSACNDFFADANAGVNRFPRPTGLGTCKAKDCVKGEKLGLCHH